MKTFFRFVLFHILEILRWPVMVLSKSLAFLCFACLLMGFIPTFSAVMPYSTKIMLMVYLTILTIIFIGYDYLLVFTHPFSGRR